MSGARPDRDYELLELTPEEIEAGITPEMVFAATEALGSYHPDWDSPFSASRRVILAILEQCPNERST